MNRKSRRVDRWIDDLLHGRWPRRMRGAQEEADVLRAAIEMRMGTPDAGLPDPRFVESLRQRLGRETQGQVPHARQVSRRTLLASGGLAAATAAAGVLVGERLNSGPEIEHTLVPDASTWTPVATLDNLPPGSAMPFSTAAMRGFLVNDGGRITALSGVCTHLGCLLRLNASARRLDCPCHNAAFALDGQVAFHSMPQALPPLPQINARVRDGVIEVLSA